MYTGIKAVNNSYNLDNNTNITISFATTKPFEWTANEFALAQTEQTQAASSVSTSELKQKLETAKQEQGLIGKLWDGFKNLTGIGAGSSKAQKAIEDYENGKITEEEMNKAVKGYIDGQETALDVVADMASGIAAFGAFALAAGVGIATSPFTCGASLGLVTAGFGIAGIAGAATKVAIKGIDSAIGKREYDTLVYDLATGGINGMFAPITAGIGGAAGKAVASKVGVTAIKEGGEVVVKEALEGTVRGTLTKTLLTTNVSYIGGTMGTRALAMGTDMAVNGAITGAVDSATRYIAGDEENKTLKGFAQEVATGAIGGLVLSPIIGGGMRVVGNGLGKVTGKLETKISTNYAQAKSAMMNVPVVDNPDAEVVKGLGNVLKQAKTLVDDIQIKSSDLSDGLDRSLYDVSDNIMGIINSVSTFNSELNAMSKENRALVLEILNEIAQGKDASSKVVELAQKGITLTDLLDSKIGTLSSQLDENLAKIMAANDNLAQKAVSGIEFTSQTLDNASNLAEDIIELIQKTPETNAYKQLGDLPDKAKSLYSTLRTDAASLDDMAQNARTKILSGNIKEGLEDLTKYYNEVDIFDQKLEQQISSMQSSAARSGIEESSEVLKARLTKLTSSADFQNMTREQQIQAIIEESNILFSKFAQTLSSDDRLPTEITDILKQFTSNCTVSRNVQQAQSLADELYGAGKYTIKKSFGAGTIGETYLAETTDGTDVVIKMLKEGVTSEKFAEDRAMFTRYIDEFVTDSTEKEYKSNLINSMFDAWDRELDFGLEAQGAKTMADGAERFSVAQTLEVGSKNGRNISLVMEKADGVQLDSLLEMVQLYKENPTEYFTKYAKEIEANPALKTPENWINDLGTAYQKAENEQIMFIKESGTRTIHADPHPGNVFVDFDTTTGKPKIVYIDTGNTISRTNSQTLQDLSLSASMMIGNSEGIANSVLEGATIPAGADKTELAQKLAQLLDERLYKAGVNLQSTQYTQNTINSIVKELNIVLDSGDSNLMKATLQRIETSRAINRACGTTSSKTVNIKDLAKGILKSFKANPKGTIQTIKPIIKWAYKNNDQAMLTFFQMIMKNAGTQTSTAVS